jgi:hypothetical protein
MRIWLIAVLLALAVGYARGGRLGRLAKLPSPASLLALVWTAALLELVEGYVPEGRRFAVQLASYLLVSVFLVAYLVVLHRRGVGRGVLAGGAVVGAGWILNLAVILANGGMPVSHRALVRAGIAWIGDVRHGNLYKHVPLGPGTHLGFLGDAIPVPMWPGGIVVSAGDVVLAAGFFLFVVAALGSRRAAPSELRQPPLEEAALGV